MNSSSEQVVKVPACLPILGKLSKGEKQKSVPGQCRKQWKVKVIISWALWFRMVGTLSWILQSEVSALNIDAHEKEIHYQLTAFFFLLVLV